MLKLILIGAAIAAGGVLAGSAVAVAALRASEHSGPAATIAVVSSTVLALALMVWRGFRVG
jgi:hypothetical protein